VAVITRAPTQNMVFIDIIYFFMSHIAVFVLCAARCPEFSLPLWFTKTLYIYSLFSSRCYLPYQKVKQSRYRPGVAQRVPGS